MQSVPEQYRVESQRQDESSPRQQSASRALLTARPLTWAFVCWPRAVAQRLREEGRKPQAGPPEVLVAEVAQQNVPIFQEWVAQLTGPVNADITPKVQGYLLRQDYQNGYFVKKGQLLFELDPRQYQAGVEHAKARWRERQAAVEALSERRYPRYSAGGAERDSSKATRQRHSPAKLREGPDTGG